MEMCIYIYGSWPKIVSQMRAFVAGPYHKPYSYCFRTVPLYLGRLVKEVTISQLGALCIHHEATRATVTISGKA